MIYPEGPKPSDRILAGARIRAEAAADPNAAGGDVLYAERYEQRARTKDLPAELTRVGAGGELIDPNSRTPGRGDIVNTVESPDYVTAEASCDRLELANQAGALGAALDAADLIQAQDSLEKMLVHEMTVLHRGIMKAAVRMNEELDAAGVLKGDLREAANVRACRLAGAIARMSSTFQQGVLTLQRKRSGGRQHVTVTYQQVNVEGGGQAVVGNGVTVGGRARRKRSGVGARNGQ